LKGKKKGKKKKKKKKRRAITAASIEEGGGTGRGEGKKKKGSRILEPLCILREKKKEVEISIISKEEKKIKARKGKMEI